MRKGNKIAVGAGIAAIIGSVVLFFQKKPPIPPGDVIISDLLIDPSEVMVGEPVTISVIATNIGDTAGSTTINCEVS